MLRFYFLQAKRYSTSKFVQNIKSFPFKGKLYVLTKIDYNFSSKKLNVADIQINNAESVRFELTEQLLVHRFSRPTHSTTLATFQFDN